MPRKDKRKKTKKPKAKPKRTLLITPPKGKPCVDCGYKPSSGFSIPFGYADFLGTQRLSNTQPIININLAKQYEELGVPIKKSIGTQIEFAKGYPTEPYIPLRESKISTKPVKKDISIGKFVEPFLGFEDVYQAPYEKDINVSQGTTQERFKGVVEIPPPARRIRRTDVEVVADLIVKKEGKSYDEAIAAALELSKTKGALKYMKQQLKKSEK